MKSIVDRFKVGDVLVKCNECNDSTNYTYIPDNVEVEVIKCDGDGAPRVRYFDNEYNQWFEDYINDKHFELAEIVNTPLWKALA